MTGTGQFGPLEMGGMFTVFKVRKDQKPGNYSDPGAYKFPAGTRGTEYRENGFGRRCHQCALGRIQSNVDTRRSDE